MRVFFNDGHVAPGHGADTTRKSDQIATVLATGRAPSRRPPPPPPHGTAFATTNSDRLSQVVPSLRAQAANTFLAHNDNARNKRITRNEPKT
jgi:hypothetical protein